MPFQPEQFEARALAEPYWRRVLVAVNQLANVLAGGNPDETISSRSERARQRGDWWGKAMIWWLDKLQPQHGQKAEAGDLARAEKVEDTERKALGEKPE